MALLDSYVDQISLSAKSIAELQFPPPKIFTNAQLGNHEITTLIRDTEAHEYALFSLNPTLVQENGPRLERQSERYGQRTLLSSTLPVRQSAIAKVLGNDLLRAIRETSGSAARSKTDVDIEVLLAGVEKLSEAYTVPGVSEKVVSIRHRYQQTAASLETYTIKVKQQQMKLNRSNIASHADADTLATGEVGSQVQVVTVTEQDLENEEAEIRELEARKRTLEERVNGMERDLGGLLR